MVLDENNWQDVVHTYQLISTINAINGGRRKGNKDLAARSALN